jgi:hypothetical protein
MSEANLCGANLRDADLASVVLRGAYYDLDTQFPDGFDPVKEEMHRRTDRKKGTKPDLNQPPPPPPRFLGG